MRHWRLIAPVVLLVAIGGGFFGWRWEQRGPGRPSVGGAIGRFRTSGPVADAPHALQPSGGVYVYSASGSEALSFLKTRQGQGPTEPGTVTPEPHGCWQFRMDFNTFHDQTWTRCSTKGMLVETGGTTDQRFDFVTFKISEHSAVTCNPRIVIADLAASPGAQRPVHCTGRSKTTKTTFTQTGTASFVGHETVLVGAVHVPALHTRERLRLSGGQTGTVDIDIWFATANGLPLKEMHDINVVSPAPAPLNHVTYAEHGSWQLTSMTPRT